MVTPLPSRQRLPVGLCFAAALFGLGPALAPAALANSVILECGGLFAAAVTDDDDGADGSPVDLDLDTDQIEFIFECTDVPGLWGANGRVFASVAEGGSALTRVTDFSVENLGLGFVLTGHDAGGTGVMNLTHSFETFGPEIETRGFFFGAFDNLDGAAVIGGATLFFEVQASGVTIFDGGIGAVAGAPPPVPIAFVSDPLVTQAVVGHFLEIGFYLDSPGDAIVAPGSIDLRSVPEPAAALLAALGLAALAARRRRAPGTSATALASSAKLAGSGTQMVATQTSSMLVDWSNFT